MQCIKQKTLIIALLGVVQIHLASAQSINYMSLNECVKFALDNHHSLKISRFDEYIAQKKVMELRGAGLPQINAKYDINDNLILPTQLIPADQFGTDGITQAIQPLYEIHGIPFETETNSEPLEAQFGVQYAMNAGLTISQLVFDGSFFVGLQAAKTYVQLSEEKTQMSRIDVASNVSKAYYTALASQERFKLMDINLKRIESVLKETLAIYESGFAEKLDVDRLQLSLSNLKIERDKMRSMVNLTLDLLKFQMGFDVNSPIGLSDTVNVVDFEPDQENLQADVDYYQNRIEYRLLDTQQYLQKLNSRRLKVGNLPSIGAFGSFGLSTQADELKNLGERWFPSLIAGIQINMAVFTGLRGKAQHDQVKLEIEKIKANKDNLRQAVSLELRQARMSVDNAVRNLESYRQNLVLAQSIYDVSVIKYKEGVGANLEVIDAESELSQNQTNYISAFYDYLLAKLDLSKAKGQLLEDLNIK